MSPHSHLLAPLRTLRAAAVFLLPSLAIGLASPAGAAVMISQVYGGGGNTGATFTADYVELHNNGTSAVSLAGWTLQYASATGTGWTNTTALSGSIPAGGYFLVRGATGAVGAPLPVTPDVTGSVNMSATAGKLALVSNTTALAGACPTGGAIVDFVGFGGTASCFETAAAPAPSNSTSIVRNSTGNSCVDTGNNSTDFIVLNPPLPRNSGSQAQPCVPTGGGGGTPTDAAIYAIQGSGATSPLVGQRVRTDGVVTKVQSNGFFIQDASGDGNPATSDGIFVFTSSAPPAAAAAGNRVQVTGTVVEFASGAGTTATPLTEISNPTDITVLGTGLTITPVTVTLPLAAGDSLERFEGMLVRIDGALTVQQNFFQARFGQVTIGAGRHETPTNRFRPNSPQAIALADLQARSRLLLDDGSAVQNPNPVPYFLADGVPRAGDAVSNLVGVLDFGLATSTASGPGLYRLQPTATPSFAAANPRPAAPADVGGNLKLGAMNVLNFFTTFTNGETATGQTGQGCSLGGSVSAGNCRGADNITEFTRQRAKIVRALAGLNADAVGLMEIQNNGNVAAQHLVDALNAVVGAGTYAVVPVPAQGTGTDAIRVAMIYKPGRLALSGAPVSDPAAVNNRPTLAQTFAGANGEKFTLVVNHLKSKGSCPSGPGPDADQGDGQGCWNDTRVQQAQQLRTFVAQLQSTSGVGDVLLVGDFNAYGQEDPIFQLTSNGYVDQASRFSPLAYSYVFDGMAGRLDHAIATASLSPKIAGAQYWHINADESIAYDYNLEFKAPATTCGGAGGLCPPDATNPNDPFRSSDHDPVLVGMDLYKLVQATTLRELLQGTPGADRFVFSSVLQGGDAISGFQPGIDQIVLKDLLASLGRSAVADPLGSGTVSCVGSRLGAVVQVDTDGSAGPQAPRALVQLNGLGCAAVMTPQNFVFR